MARKQTVARTTKARKVSRQLHNHCEWLNDRHVGYCEAAARNVFRHRLGMNGVLYVCDVHAIDASGDGKRLFVGGQPIGGPIQMLEPARPDSIGRTAEPEPEPEDPRPAAEPVSGWDEPAGCTSPRGWYFVDGLCRGNYLDYTGTTEPGRDGAMIHAVAYAMPGDRNLAVGWCDTIDEARAFIEEAFTAYARRRAA